MGNITNVAITGENGVATYDDGSKTLFLCSPETAGVIADLATSLRAERTKSIATGDRLRRMYTGDRSRRASTRDSDMFTRGGNGAPLTSTAPTAMDAEFMRLVRAVAPKYDNALPGTDPRLVALDVLRYAPVEAFSAVYPKPLAEIQLDQAIDVLEQVGDYMKSNNVTPKVLTTADSIRQINADSAKFWGRK